MRLQAVATAIGESLGVRLRPGPASRVHGGSINECYRWESDRGPVFVKIAPAQSVGDALFQSEAAGLRALRRAAAVRVPDVLGAGVHAGTAWLALEWIDSRASSRQSDSLLGHQLAIQHRSLGPAFGWDRDNCIGSTPQLNTWTQDWVTFFRERRLRYQLDLAASRGHGGRLQQRGALLLEHLGGFFRPYRPAPSLLHGDLWGGNRLTDDQGRPVIFDPAVYYGDREADLAMTRLFGGFGVELHAAYEAAWALEAGAAARIDLYNTYHVLNHLNLFGAAYLTQARSLIDRLLAELGH